MAAIQRKLVHKQFNSPMGLYSAQNVKETLHRELKAFGGDGIEVDESVLKPSNLANSAVLKALEEEENEQYGGYKRVAWPPVSEGRTIREFTPQPSPQPPYQQQPQQQQQQQQQQQRPGASPVPAPNQGGHYIQSQPNYQSSYPNQQQLQQQQQPSPQEPYYLQQRSSQPSAAADKPSSTVSFSGGIAQPVYNTPKPQTQPQYQYRPQSPLPQPQQQQQQLYQPPPSPEPQQQYHQQQQQQQQQYQPQADYPQQGGHQLLDEPPRGRWSHVASPVPQRTGYVQNYQQSPQASTAVQPSFGSAQPSYGTPQQQPEPHQQHPQQQQLQQQQYRGESPGIITLRKEAPITQQPAPVYTSQPAAASFRGGSNMRGDLKWPPPEYKEQAVQENEERRRVAQGPVCRPRRINKDYTQFFAKNALSHHYPSYKVPPGTQHIYGTY